MACTERAEVIHCKPLTNVPTSKHDVLPVAQKSSVLPVALVPTNTRLIHNAKHTRSLVYEIQSALPLKCDTLTYFNPVSVYDKIRCQYLLLVISLHQITHNNT